MLDPNDDFTGLFKTATQSTALKEFIQENPHIIEKLPLLLHQPANSSIHAAGVVIVPKIDSIGVIKPVQDWMPIKMMDGLIVSEWEGEYVDKMGFLKCDILGLGQLDKFMRINELIKEHYGKTIGYDDINLDEEGVFELFRNGHNEDVFQFTGYGLRKYCQDLLPENINDLIATVAIYRPGPIEIGVHTDYVKIKNGQKELHYDFNSEEITKNTYGLWIYQEQIMQACTAIAGFNMTEADGVRKGIGKMIPELLKSYGTQFVAGAIKNGCPEEEAIKIWKKFEVFGAYSFNLSHSACYAIMGYFSQWFKYMYPLEFWTTSLEYSEADEMIQKIAEIEALGTVKVAPVDINKSREYFYPDKNNNTIYWSISSIKWVGNSGVDSIIEQRTNSGDFFSLEEFYSRVERRKVNKRSMENLIFSGAFDEIESIRNVKDRYSLLVQFYNISSNQKLLPELDEYKRWPEYRWIVKQKELTGFGFIEYRNIFTTSEFKKQIGSYLSGDDLENENHLDKEKIVGGIIKNLVERKSKRGPFYQIELENNFSTIYITCWNEAFEVFKIQLKENVGGVCFIKGKVVRDNYKNKNVIHTNENTVMTFL